MGKRVFDLVVAAIALALLWPLLLGIALWIRLDSPGPALFRQERIGRGGRPFRIRKFRTMAHEPQQAGPLLTVGDDRRITRAGRWLRRTKLDELPQLLDVLQGHMSIVGPRPEVARYVAQYPPALRDKVLTLRPGITDPVSLSLLDESELLSAADDPERYYVDVILPRKLQLAAGYAERATVLTDLAVVGRTLATLGQRLRKEAR